MLDIDVVSSHF